MSRLTVAALTLLAIACGACATAPKDPAAAAGPRSGSFDSWAVGNGTGAFFKAVGPANGTGIR
jgi:hypothetical protein